MTDDFGTQAFVERVEHRLAESLEPGDGEAAALLAEAGRHLVLAGGKRLRPRLVEIFGAACGADPAALVDVAAGAELIHAASLLHDDVVDDGHRRRGLPTVNARWGNTVAVLAGDWLLSLALARLRPYDPEILRRGVEVVASMTLAAMQEVQARGRPALTTTAWRRIAEGKTGVLFAWCGEAAALLGGDPQAAARFTRFGTHLGVAFQMADDLRDLYGTDGEKDRWSDLRNRNPSFVVTLAAERSPHIRDLLASAWRTDAPDAAAVNALGDALLSEGHGTTSVAALRREIDAALDALGSDRETTWGRAIEAVARRFCAGLG